MQIFGICYSVDILRYLGCRGEWQLWYLGILMGLVIISNINVMHNVRSPRQLEFRDS